MFWGAGKFESHRVGWKLADLRSRGKISSSLENLSFAFKTVY